MTVSAFCNAGISTFPKGLGGFEQDISSSAVLFVLLVAGGIGFLSIAEIYDKLSESYKRKAKMVWTFQFKIILLYTFVSIAVGSILIFALEFHGALSPIPVAQQVSTPSITRVEFMPILFEAVSAFGTVGLSMGLTPHLSFYGKLVIIIVMILGRLGPLTIAMVIATQKKETRYMYAEETVMVG